METNESNGTASSSDSPIGMQSRVHQVPTTPEKGEKRPNPIARKMLNPVLGKAKTTKHQDIKVSGGDVVARAAPIDIPKLKLSFLNNGKSQRMHDVVHEPLTPDQVTDVKRQVLERRRLRSESSPPAPASAKSYRPIGLAHGQSSPPAPASARSYRPSDSLQLPLPPPQLTPRITSSTSFDSLSVSPVSTMDASCKVSPQTPELPLWHVLKTADLPGRTKNVQNALPSLSENPATDKPRDQLREASAKKEERESAQDGHHHRMQDLFSPRAQMTPRGASNKAVSPPAPSPSLYPKHSLVTEAIPQALEVDAGTIKGPLGVFSMRAHTSSSSEARRAEKPSAPKGDSDVRENGISSEADTPEPANIIASTQELPGKEGVQAPGETCVQPCARTPGLQRTAAALQSPRNILQKQEGWQSPTTAAKTAAGEAAEVAACAAAAVTIIRRDEAKPGPRDSHFQEHGVPGRALHHVVTTGSATQSKWAPQPAGDRGGHYRSLLHVGRQGSGKEGACVAETEVGSSWWDKVGAPFVSAHASRAREDGDRQYESEQHGDGDVDATLHGHVLLSSPWDRYTLAYIRKSHGKSRRRILMSRRQLQLWVRCGPGTEMAYTYMAYFTTLAINVWDGWTAFVEARRRVRQCAQSECRRACMRCMTAWEQWLCVEKQRQQQEKDQQSRRHEQLTHASILSLRQARAREILNLRALWSSWCRLARVGMCPRCCASDSLSSTHSPHAHEALTRTRVALLGRSTVMTLVHFARTWCADASCENALRHQMAQLHRVFHCWVQAKDAAASSGACQVERILIENLSKGLHDVQSSLAICLSLAFAQTTVRKSMSPAMCSRASSDSGQGLDSEELADTQVLPKIEFSSRSYGSAHKDPSQALRASEAPQSQGSTNRRANGKSVDFDVSHIAWSLEALHGFGAVPFTPSDVARVPDTPRGDAFKDGQDAGNVEQPFLLPDGWKTRVSRRWLKRFYYNSSTGDVHSVLFIGVDQGSGPGMDRASEFGTERVAFVSGQTLWTRPAETQPQTLATNAQDRATKDEDDDALSCYTPSVMSVASIHETDTVDGEGAGIGTEAEGSAERNETCQEDQHQAKSFVGGVGFSFNSGYGALDVDESICTKTPHLTSSTADAMLIQRTAGGGILRGARLGARHAGSQEVDRRLKALADHTDTTTISEMDVGEAGATVEWEADPSTAHLAEVLRRRGLVNQLMQSLKDSEFGAEKVRHVRRVTALRLLRRCNWNVNTATSVALAVLRGHFASGSSDGGGDEFVDAVLLNIASVTSEASLQETGEDNEAKNTEVVDKGEWRPNSSHGLSKNELTDREGSIAWNLEAGPPSSSPPRSPRDIAIEQNANLGPPRSPIPKSPRKVRMQSPKGNSLRNADFGPPRSSFPVSPRAATIYRMQRKMAVSDGPPLRPPPCPYPSSLEPRSAVSKQSPATGLRDLKNPFCLAEFDESLPRSSFGAAENEAGANAVRNSQNRFHDSDSQIDGASQNQDVRASEKRCGLGITFFPPADGNDYFVIKRVKEGGGAAGCGKIRAGDRLVTIDGHQVNSRLCGSKLQSLLLGVPGSICTVRIQHENGAVENIQLARAARKNSLSPSQGDSSEKSIDDSSLVTATSRRSPKREVNARGREKRLAPAIKAPPHRNENLEHYYSVVGPAGYYPPPRPLPASPLPIEADG